MGRKRAIVVAGPEGLDEVGLNGTTKYCPSWKMAKSFCQPLLQKIWEWKCIAIEDIRGGTVQYRMQPFCSAFLKTNQVHSWKRQS